MENESEIEKLARMVKEGFDRMGEQFERIDRRFDTLSGEMRDGFAAVNKRVDLLDQKVDRVDAKLDQHRQETKDGFAAVHRFIGDISTTLSDHEQRIKELEGE
jgi:tetrahydromethanopterin S-methyltransferase subunit G